MKSSVVARKLCGERVGAGGGADREVAGDAEEDRGADPAADLDARAPHHEGRHRHVVGGAREGQAVNLEPAVGEEDELVVGRAEVRRSIGEAGDRIGGRHRLVGLRRGRGGAGREQSPSAASLLFAAWARPRPRPRSLAHPWSLLNMTPILLRKASPHWALRGDGRTSPL